MDTSTYYRVSRFNLTKKYRHQPNIIVIALLANSVNYFIIISQIRVFKKTLGKCRIKENAVVQKKHIGASLILKSYSLTNNMSSKIVLKLNIVVLLPPKFINKHGFEVVSEKVRVGGQVKLEMSEVEKKKKHYITTNITAWLLSVL